MIAIFLIGAVGAADVDDANLTETSQDSDVPVYDENVTELQNASFGKVSQETYLIGQTFDVKLLDNESKGLSNKSVFFTVNNDVSEVVTDDNGVAKFLLNFKKGTYTINFNFNDSSYNPIKGSKKILLLSKPTSTIKGSNVKMYAGIKYSYKVTLKADGILLANKKVKFIVNKKTYFKNTNSKGVATLTLYLAKGTYTVRYYFASEKNINASKSSSKAKVKLLKNPYGTKYRTVIIDADGGFTKAFLKDMANKLRKGGWKVIVKGIGPNQHSINYKKVKNAVYMPIYNGLCAATIKEMAASYYGGVIKYNKGVLTPAWFTGDWVSAKMSKFRNDITKFGFLKRAWDDNFSPKSFKGINDPAKFMTQNKIRYCIGDTTYKIAQQFLYGGWVAAQKVK